MPQTYTPVEAVAWVETVPIPVDGEGASERNFAPAWQRCADREQYLYRRLPRAYSYAYDNEDGVFWTYANTYALETTESVSGLIDVPDCVVGDKIQVSCFLNWSRGAAALTTDWDAWIDAIDDYDGDNEVQDHVPGTRWNALGIDTLLNDDRLPLSMTGVWTVTVAGTTRITFALDADNWAAGTFKIYSAFNLSAIRYPV